MCLLLSLSHFRFSNWRRDIDDVDKEIASVNLYEDDIGLSRAVSISHTGIIYLVEVVERRKSISKGRSSQQPRA